MKILAAAGDRRTAEGGNYISARSVGGTARVILRYDPQWNFPFLYPESAAGEDVAGYSRLPDRAFR